VPLSLNPELQRQEFPLRKRLELLLQVKQFELVVPLQVKHEGWQANLFLE